MDTFYVIARAYGDEPKRLWATVYEGALLVAGEAREDWIGYPLAYVFTWEPRLFARLCAAFSSGSTKSLRELWGAAEPLKL